ncbi:hypothetical protein BDV93DRAFT_537179 [Ceratobasidium sp. AG-I]|nr:hypothetical protein BDV93DRAFT_537179 [Ceratobasidium sp. AG-I]
MASPSSSKKPSDSSRRGARDRRNEPVEVRNSKTLSYILRHGAAKEHLAIRSDGYVRVADLLARPKMKELDLAGLLKIVEADQKQRYQLGVQTSSDGPNIVIQSLQRGEVPEEGAELWIRANQGHTIKVDDLELKPVMDAADLACAVHGTTSVAWESIKKQGLSHMRRNHIHLASGRPGESGVISGMRVSSQVIIFIDVVAAMAAGISFHTSTNGVILTTGDSSGFIPPTYFSSVERKVDSGWESIPLPQDISDRNQTEG